MLFDEITHKMEKMLTKKERKVDGLEKKVAGASKGIGCWKSCEAPA
mgnify:CR=1 FL=1